MSSDLIEVMQDGDDGPVLRFPAIYDFKKIARCRRVDGGKRLVENDELRILKEQAGKQHALELAG